MKIRNYWNLRDFGAGIWEKSNRIQRVLIVLVSIFLIGLLPFIQTEQKRNRKYYKIASLTRIELIKKLKTEQRLTIEEIKKYFQKN